MNEPTEFKYPLDEYGEPYFAGSHVDAIEGMQDIKDRLDQDEVNIQQNNTNVTYLENTLKGFVGVTDWVSYANNVAPGVQVNAAYGGMELKCELKEVRVGIEGLTPVVRYKTITYNIRNFPPGSKVAQLPTGFVTKAIAFPAYGNGNVGSYKIEILKDGSMNVFVGTNDKNLPINSYWIYGQHTWIE